MEDIITLKSRGENNSFLKKLKKPGKEDSKTYLLKTDSPILRTGFTEGNHKKWIDPTGGPVITEGNTLEEADAVVKSIDFIIGYGCTITFE